MMRVATWVVTKPWRTGGQPFRRRRRRDGDARTSGFHNRRALESLEPRWPLASHLIISELVASNDQGIEDEDGDDSDWLELYNDGDEPAELHGWFLTDDPTDLRKWEFPPTTVEPQQYLVVFASGKDRRVPGFNLHTNFALSAGGEYLGLIHSDGTTVAHGFNPFPTMEADLAFGLTQGMTEHSVLPEQSSVQWFVPSRENGGDQLGATWTGVDFDDAVWPSGIGGVGFELQTGFESWIGTDVGSEMLNSNGSVLMRFPFQLDRAQSAFSLALRMRYDDGYVAYLNGIEVARRNAPENLGWDSIASATHVDSQAVSQEEVNITEFLSVLRDGTNILAIHGLNSATNSNDFLISPELVASFPGEFTNFAGRYLEIPSPGAPNGEVSYANFVRSATVSVPRGIYEQALDVAIGSVTPGATLVYTTDGSVPSLENGQLVTASHPLTAPRHSLRIEQTTTVRARVFRGDDLPSRTETWTYVLPADVMKQDAAATVAAGFPPLWRRTEPDYGLDPDIVGPDDVFNGLYRDQFVTSLKSLPSLSLVMEIDDLFGERGIYTNSSDSGFEWERPTSVELISADGSMDYQIDAGIRIAGGASREHSNTKKKSFRLVFRDEYGASKLKFPVFGPGATDRFDTLVLRNNYNDGWQWSGAENLAQYARDEWTRATQLALGQPGSHGTYMHLYINGIYWGLYNLAERPDASFSAAYSGGDKDTWDSLNTGAAVNGSVDKWVEANQLAAAVDSTDVDASNAAYQRLLGRRPDGTDDPTLETLIDIDNMIDYMILNFYAGNTDWPGRNWYVGRQRGPESDGFQFYAWDSEWIFDLRSTLATNRTSVSEGVANLYARMRGNAEFRLRFADRVERAFAPGGALYVHPDHTLPDTTQPQWNVPAARYRAVTDAIELALVAESARWGDQHFEPSYTVSDWRMERDRLMTDYFSQRSAIVLEQFRQAGLYPAVETPEFSQAGGSVPAGWGLSITGRGTIYFTLDGSDPRRGVAGGATGADQPSAIAQLYTSSVALRGAVIVKARSLADGHWSPLREARFVAGPSELRISEVMYHPAAPTLAEIAAGFYSAEEFEFLEVTNVHPEATYALDGFRITDGAEFDFSEAAIETLAPNESVVVARNAAALRTRYGDGLRIVGQYGGTRDDFRLSNEGESIQLVDFSGVTVQQFTYASDWYATTAGRGHSLEIVDPRNPDLSSWSRRESWRPSDRVGGTPARRLAGDFNDDGTINLIDIRSMASALLTHDPQFDLNEDRIIDQDDWVYFVTALLNTTFGDANLDGIFNSSDLVLAFQAGHYEDSTPLNSQWSEGDWNGDGEFTTSDLVLAFQFGGYLAL